ncbi:fdxN element excision recombinase XisF [Calothrix sp. PCC 6303]|uniref:fdxN element excision recombinase XisF n=1 Tax=Calothrix sp. PCC 6303 TaxID=1170562 RepID=UPI0002A02AF6|nr:fdxN element excision recombinase XisF [Calothrix sp. PCC 6303]AFZ01050.1 Resolvase domain protein [Calothrix sp. PCC 6303]
MTRLIVGYCRVSSKQQFTDGHALERYIDALVNYGIPESLIYFDIETGVSDTREGFGAILDLVRANRISQVIIPNFDRLTRSPLQWEQARELFTKHDVQIKFLEDGELNLTSPDGLFTGRVKAALAAQVRDRLRSHSLAGHAKHREREEPYKPIFGYIKIDGAIVPNQSLYPKSDLTYFQVARKLIDLFLECKSLSKAREDFQQQFYLHPPSYKGKIHLKAPSSSTGVRSWLLNALLRGKLQYLSFGHKTPQIIIDSIHQPLITEDEWLMIKAIFEDNKTRKKGVSCDKLINPLSSVARCRNCGGAMSQRLNYKNKSGEWGRFLACRNARSRNGLCDNIYAKTYGLTLDIAEKKLQTELITRSQQIANLLPSDKPDNPKIQELKDSIQMLERLNDADLHDAIEKKRTQLFLLEENEKLGAVESSEKLKLLQYMQHPDFWEGMTPYERNLVYRELIEVVWCDRGSVVVVPRI